MTNPATIDQASVAVDVWVKLLRTHAALTRDLNADLVAAHGLTINDFEALLLLSRAEDGAMRRVDLAERLVLTPSGVTRLLDGLERGGLVEKGVCATDLRVTYAVITPAGCDRLAAAAASHHAAVRGAFEKRLRGEELATLRELLGRLPGADAAEGSDCSLLDS